jgi:hypothetical protein
MRPFGNGNGNGNQITLHLIKLLDVSLQPVLPVSQKQLLGTK